MSHNLVVWANLSSAPHMLDGTIASCCKKGGQLQEG